MVCVEKGTDEQEEKGKGVWLAAKNALSRLRRAVDRKCRPPKGWPVVAIAIVMSEQKEPVPLLKTPRQWQSRSRSRLLTLGR